MSDFIIWFAAVASLFALAISILALLISVAAFTSKEAENGKDDTD